MLYGRQLLWYCQEVLAFMLNLTMLPWFLREVVNRRRVTIVNYHDPAPDRFEKHLRHLRSRYNMISMDRLQECLTAGDFTSLPPKPMVLTFDDGHRGNARLFPVLRKYCVPSVIYAVLGVVDTRRVFWWQVRMSRAEKRRLKQVPNIERELWLERNRGYTRNREYPTRCALTAFELKEFTDQGGTIGGHTLSHPNLRACDDASLAAELSFTTTDLEMQGGHAIRYFAYPYGCWDDRVRREVIHAGYVNARTIDFGWVTSRSDPFALPCIGISDGARVFKALCQASGLWHMIFRTQRRICFSHVARTGNRCEKAIECGFRGGVA